ncbi:aminoacyl-histidine dipeptidase [Proteus mirabilis]|uniref:Aminoacyl-histidine dipeptidase n=1 Tax=Proteus mirabilis TaxID=584 RepID=A0A2X2BZ27_PROMI|nr:aminoacyl-histidine dipeptidase [Proteus mirabilis]
MPNGVIRMSDDVEGVVETSLNVGVVSIVDDKVEILCLIRSLIDSGKTYVVSMLTALAKTCSSRYRNQRWLSWLET